MNDIPPKPLRCVSRETQRRLETYVNLLTKWNQAINLVSKATLADVWERHIKDSLQLLDIADRGGQWLDLGSGAGLPGLIIAASLTDNYPDSYVTLVESDQRKCAFMATAAKAMEINVSIECRRIEESTGRTYDVISARALAPLTDLLELARPYRNNQSICIFPKGSKALLEMEIAQRTWNVTYDQTESMTEKSSTIFRIQEYSRADV